MMKIRVSDMAEQFQKTAPGLAGLHLSVPGAFLFRILCRQRQDVVSEPCLEHERIQIKWILLALADRLRLRDGFHEGQWSTSCHLWESGVNRFDTILRHEFL